MYIPRELGLYITTYTEVPPGKKRPADAGATGNMCSISGSGRSPGGGNGNPFQYSCLENPMDVGACWATVPGVTKSQTQLSTHTHTHTHTHTCPLRGNQSFTPRLHCCFLTVPPLYPLPSLPGNCLNLFCWNSGKVMQTD